MKERVVIHKGSYHDSAFLMRVSRGLAGLDCVEEAVVLMGTQMNRKLLQDAGFFDPGLEDATPMDLVVGIRAGSEEAIAAAEKELESLLRAIPSGRSGPGVRYASIRSALEEQPQTNLVSVAVPGPYAAYVAHRALDAGKHVFLFSNNVPIDEEVELKRRARELGLLVMGPDCGTAIVAGVGLGFANRVRRGRIGLVGASGTGIQEVACLVHAMGEGISQAIGVGGADLSGQVGGLMTEFGLELLAADEETRIIVLVAKHPDRAVADKIEKTITGLKKPVVVRYLGQPALESRPGVTYAESLDEAALEAVTLASGDKPADPFRGLEDDARALTSGDGRLVGLFCGGSLAAEAALVLGAGVSNHPLRVEGGVAPMGTAKSAEGTGDWIVDTGEDFYTLGRPHPMVDQTVRCELIRGVFSDPSVKVLLLDLVLGFGAHPDPASELAQTIEAARRERGDVPMLVIASVTGTDLDPQDADRQRRLLASVGVHVQRSAARAARIASMLKGGGGRVT
jgi:succinyl-CoA synthetase alpha subunit